ncbi:MAG: hypothetical protein H3C53_07095 [Trueperaceae bacterium]|nr:hypothetical protein [Trueperaceae bacterium]
MNRLEAVSARLLRPDLSQGGTLLLAVLAVVLVANWPNGGARVNESWAVVGPLRSSALALLAVVLGARQAGVAGAWGAAGPAVGRTAGTPGAAEQGADTLLDTWLALLAVALLSWPLELVAQAGSYPAVPGYWPALLAPITMSGYYGLGLLLGRLVRGRFAGALLLLLVPATCALLVWTDLALGLVVTNPWTAPAAVAPAYPPAMVALALVGLAVSRWRRHPSGVPS